MPVILRAPQAIPPATSYRFWAMVPSLDRREPRPTLDPERLRPGVGAALEDAFDAEAQTWWGVARTLSTTPSASLAHMPACAPNASDFGLMLAWTRLVRDWSREEQTTLVICGDPWMFRQLRTMPDVIAGTPSLLWPRILTLSLRGYLARGRTAVRYFIAALRMRGTARTAPQRATWLLVYGHPTSTADGIDGYFGELMRDIPTVRRVLHVDCPPARAAQLAADKRTVSLHGFGNPLYALALPFVRWRPPQAQLRGQFEWLLRRAVTQESGTGQAAAICWQIHCQAKWLHRCHPIAAAWPWENHAWERTFVRTARRAGTRTIGYQHSVIGRQMLNYAPNSDPDGTASLPDQIFCSGATTRDQLRRWKVPDDRLAVGGALRFQRRRAPSVDQSAPIFLALPFDGKTAAEMVESARCAARNGRRFVVKEHPMTPFPFEDSPGVTRTREPLDTQTSVAAVVYAATSVGLEAVLAGLPTLRFRPKARIALDILPGGINVPAVESETLSDALDHVQRPTPVAANSVFADVDMALWQKELGGV